MSTADLLQKALISLQNRNFSEAETLYRQILALEQNNDDAMFMLGMIRYNLHDYDGALAFLNQAIAHNNSNPRYYYNMGVVLRDQGECGKALDCFNQAVLLKPEYAAAHFNRGVLYHGNAHYAEALAAYKQVLLLEPKHFGAHNNMGGIYHLLGHYEEALSCYHTIASLAPEDAGALNNLAVVLKDLNRLEESLSLLKKAITLPSSTPAFHSNMVFNLHYDPAQNSDSLFKAHREWGLRYGDAPGEPHSTTPDPDKILHIGYVSGDFRSHPVGFFLMGAMAYHNPKHVKLHCYSSSGSADAVTGQIKSYASVWRDIYALGDEQAAALIRADKIDILVDLSGHTADNRLPLFARKPAPVQASWLGYFNTTGMDAMDYFISDHVHTPLGHDKWFSEKVIRLPDGYMCYTPPVTTPDPVPAPVLTKGHITFGCFNNLSKINNEVIAFFALLLQQIPTARLVLKAKALNSTRMQQHYHQCFNDHGIDPSRIDLLGWSAHLDMLKAHHAIDIALDPFPFSGGLTSCDALWMGVPVITYAGEWIVSRQTASYLTQIGLTELIADSKEAYIAIALRLSTDRTALAALRAGLRERMAASPLCDGKRFAAHLEAAYREMWRGLLGS